MFSILEKMRKAITEKIQTGDPSLYVSLAFPILFTFVLTFITARLFSLFWPQIFLEVSDDLHIHHYTYGVFIMAAAGYIGLAVSQARAKFWTAMLLGIGLGLAMDEFGMWLRLQDHDVARWSYDGFNITIGIFLFVLTIKPGIHLLKRVWPLHKRN